jgi:UDP-glucose 4-epimerase
MRVLVTGLSTYWGGRVAQALERRPDVEVVVGVDTRDPRLPLERTEFVRADSTHSILARIVRATQVDTIVHTHLIVDSTRVSGRQLHEINVIGTMNLLAAAGAPSSPVRKVVLKSSGLVYGANAADPYVFREDMTRTRAARTNVERSRV